MKRQNHQGLFRLAPSPARHPTNQEPNELDCIILELVFFHQGPVSCRVQIGDGLGSGF